MSFHDVPRSFDMTQDETANQANELDFAPLGLNDQHAVNFPAFDENMIDSDVLSYVPEPNAQPAGAAEDHQWQLAVEHYGPGSLACPPELPFEHSDELNAASYVLDDQQTVGLSFADGSIVDASSYVPGFDAQFTIADGYHGDDLDGEDHGVGQHQTTLVPDTSIGHQPVEAYQALTNLLALPMPQSSLMEGFNDIPSFMNQMSGTDAFANATFGDAEQVYNPPFLGPIDASQSIAGLASTLYPLRLDVPQILEAMATDLVALPGSSLPALDAHVHHRDHGLQRSHAPEAIIPVPLSPPYEPPALAISPFDVSTHGEVGPGLDAPLVPFPPSFSAGTQDNAAITSVPSPPSTLLPTATTSALPTPNNNPAFRFPCTYTGCETTFSTIYDQARHYRSVHEQMKIRCAACKGSFSRKDALKRHIKSSDVNHVKSKCLLFCEEKAFEDTGDQGRWWSVAAKLGELNGGGDAKS